MRITDKIFKKSEVFVNNNQPQIAFHYGNNNLSVNNSISGNVSLREITASAQDN